MPRKNINAGASGLGATHEKAQKERDKQCRKLLAELRAKTPGSGSDELRFSSPSGGASDDDKHRL